MEFKSSFIAGDILVHKNNPSLQVMVERIEDNKYYLRLLFLDRVAENYPINTSEVDIVFRLATKIDRVLYGN